MLFSLHKFRLNKLKFHIEYDVIQGIPLFCNSSHEIYFVDIILFQHWGFLHVCMCDEMVFYELRCCRKKHNENEQYLIFETFLYEVNTLLKFYAGKYNSRLIFLVIFLRLINL